MANKGKKINYKRKKIMVPAPEGVITNHTAKAWAMFRSNALPSLRIAMSPKAKIQSPEEMFARASEYFEACDKDHRAYTLSGLCLALGVSRVALNVTYRDNPLFSDIVSWAKIRIEQQLEEGLWVPKIAQGVAFALKNGFGWQEKHEVEHSGSVNFAHWLQNAIDATPNVEQDEADAISVLPSNN